MRIDTLSHAFALPYFQEESPRNFDERLSSYEPLKNPPAVRHATYELTMNKDRLPGDGTALSPLLNRYGSDSLEQPVFYTAYDPGNGIYQPTDQFFMKVKAAYTGQNGSRHKGLNVDKHI